MTMSSYEERLHDIAVSAVVAAPWDPLLHPRAANGQFIRIGGWVRGLFRVGSDTEKLNGKVISIKENKQNPRDPLIKVITKHGELTTVASKISEAVKPKGFLSKIVNKDDAAIAAYKQKPMDGDFTFESNIPLEGRVLNGIPLSEVDFDPHTVADIDVGEPPLEPLTTGMKQSAGVMIEEPDGRIWLYEPANHFGGYRATFSKGRIDEGDTAQQAAMREAYEELGLVTEITGYIGDYKGSVTMTRLYSGRRVGGAPWKHDAEVAEVRLVSPDTAAGQLHAERDLQILSDFTGDTTYIDAWRRADDERKARQERERQARAAEAAKKAAQNPKPKATGGWVKGKDGSWHHAPQSSQQALLDRTTKPGKQSTTADKMLKNWKPGL